MQFTFTEDQLLFRSAVRDLLENECPASKVRELGESETGRDPALWKALSDMGVVGLLVPEAHGGLGMDEVDLVGVLIEMGRAALPAPVIESIAVAPRLIARVGTPEWQAAWLDKLAGGEAVVTFSPLRAPYVADAHIADLLLLEADDGSLHAVAPDAVALTRQESLDPARRIFSVDWTPSPETEVAEGHAAASAIHDACDRAAVAAAALLVGMGDRMIEIAGDYARERHQFGKPIGSFQAVKHLMADALLKVEFAKAPLYAAAFDVANDGEHASRSASMAKAFASRAADRAARATLQVHGAIGYTLECDLQLWMKPAWALAAAWGDARFHRDRVGRSLDI